MSGAPGMSPVLGGKPDLMNMIAAELEKQGQLPPDWQGQFGTMSVQDKATQDEKKKTAAKKKATAGDLAGYKGKFARAMGFGEYGGAAGSKGREFIPTGFGFMGQKGRGQFGADWMSKAPQFTGTDYANIGPTKQRFGELMGITGSNLDEIFKPPTAQPPAQQPTAAQDGTSGLLDLIKKSQSRGGGKMGFAGKLGFLGG